MKRLKSVGESMAPWGTPFCRCMVLDLCFLFMTCAVLPAIKFVSHFLVLFGRLVSSIFCARMCLGTVSNALFMSITAKTVRAGGAFWLKPSNMCCV